MKSGIRMHGIAIADDIWFTCCAFHNMLLHEDGLDKRWTKGRQSEYEGELGWHAVGDVETYAPLIFRRVNSGMSGNMRSLDSSRLGRNDNDIVFDGDDTEDEADVCRRRAGGHLRCEIQRGPRAGHKQRDRYHT